MTGHGTPRAPGQVRLLYDDPEQVIADLERGLTRALVTRGEVHHLRSCLASGVNSQVYPCSPKCIEVQDALRQAQTWLAARRPAGLPAEGVAG